MYRNVDYSFFHAGSWEVAQMVSSMIGDLLMTKAKELLKLNVPGPTEAQQLMT